jgi:hypothetical protein
MTSSVNSVFLADASRGRDVKTYIESSMKPSLSSLWFDLIGIPQPIVMRPELTDEKVHVKVKSKRSPTSASLHYTTGTVPINKLDWESMSARVEGKRIISPAPPDEATIWFLTVSDNRGAVVSSELVFSNE